MASGRTTNTKSYLKKKATQLATGPGCDSRPKAGPNSVTVSLARPSEKHTDYLTNKKDQ